jgi:hypothetical protein
MSSANSVDPVKSQKMGWVRSLDEYEFQNEKYKKNKIEFQIKSNSNPKNPLIHRHAVL